MTSLQTLDVRWVPKYVYLKKWAEGLKNLGMIVLRRLLNLQFQPNGGKRI